MKLSISNIAWDETKDEIVYQMMQKHGFCGLEIAPTRWVSTMPYAHCKDAAEIAEKLRTTYGFTISSMQSIWYGKNERLFASTNERDILIAYTKEAIDYAKAIDCKNLVFGCPRNRNIAAEWGISDGEKEQIEKAFFATLGSYAAEKGVTLSMEANPPIYNTNYINATVQAIELVERTATDGFLLNLDVGTMIANKEEVDVLAGKGKLIHHVHISEPGMKMIEQRALHQELAALLKMEQYQGYISIEMGKQEDMKQIEKAMEYVAEVFCD